MDDHTINDHITAATAKIFRARTVVTMTGGRDSADAFAVLGERIVARGMAGDLATRFPDAERIDFGDATIVPGFNDAHMHLSMTADDLLHADLFARHVPSISAIKSRLRQEVERTPPGGWIRGSRYDDAKMAERRVLTRDDLDDVSLEIPILVVHIAGHWGVVNSKALELAGIHEESKPPPGGKLGRDATGRLNGLLFEQALFRMAYPAAVRSGGAVAPASTFEQRLEGLGRAVKMFHASGLTSIGDAFAGPSDLKLFQEGRHRGLLTLRVNMLLGYAHYEHLRKLGVRSGFGDEHIRINGVKALVDGAIGGRTCLMEQPFEGTTDDFGIQTMSTNDLRDVVNMVQEDGTRIGVHANGDRAISLLLDLLEAAENKRSRPDLHHRIEHCTIINEDILKRMKRLGAIAVPFGNYVNYHGGRLLDWYGPQRVRRMFACRSFIDAGVAVAGSSDYPCSPFEPLEAMRSCVTRRGFDGVAVGENQRITPLEALGLYTTGAAYATGEEHIKGRLAPGYLADFVVLDRNPLATDANALDSIRVCGTYVGGDCVFHQD